MSQNLYSKQVLVRFAGLLREEMTESIARAESYSNSGTLSGVTKYSNEVNYARAIQSVTTALLTALSETSDE